MDRSFPWHVIHGVASVGHDWASELNWTDGLKNYILFAKTKKYKTRSDQFPTYSTYALLQLQKNNTENM